MSASLFQSDSVHEQPQTRRRTRLFGFPTCSLASAEITSDATQQKKNYPVGDHHVRSFIAGVKRSAHTNAPNVKIGYLLNGSAAPSYYNLLRHVMYAGETQRDRTRAGFQLLDVSEDGDRAMGFFVFEVADRIIDAPIFLIDGEVKGKELLFLRDRQAFIPS